MIKALFFLWNKDIVLRLTLVVIACIIVVGTFVIKDATGASLLSMLLVFSAGTLAVNDMFSGLKGQVQLSVSPVGRDTYILAKFMWADMWTFVFFAFSTIVSVMAALIYGKTIVLTLVGWPFVAFLFAMLMNCVSVPCSCLLPRRIGTVVEIVFVLGVLLLMGPLVNGIMQDEKLFISLVEFFINLSTFSLLLLALGGFVLCTVLQWLTWICLRRAHQKCSV